MSLRIFCWSFWKGNNHNASVSAVQIGAGERDCRFVLLMVDLLAVYAKKAPR
jgi:hypothetical protein